MRVLSDRRVVTAFALVLVSGSCVALVAARAWHAGAHDYRFLVWNLVLAWVPFLLALAFYDFHRRGRSGATLGVLGALWLLFLPNAPYMVTDLVHLGRFSGAPLWYDGAMISAFAGTGLLLGLCSILLIHTVAIETLGRLRAWIVLAPVFALCSLGVFLGRFVRLNSWDVLLRPGRLLDLGGSYLADPLASQRAIAATVGYAVFLGLAYRVLYSVSSLRLEPEHQEPH